VVLPPLRWGEFPVLFTQSCTGVVYPPFHTFTLYTLIFKLLSPAPLSPCSTALFTAGGCFKSFTKNLIFACSSYFTNPWSKYHKCAIICFHFCCIRLNTKFAIFSNNFINPIMMISIEN